MYMILPLLILTASGQDLVFSILVSKVTISSNPISIFVNLDRLSFWVLILECFSSIVAVYGMEYGFGAHDYSISGVFEVEPKSCPGFSYRCSISLGHLSMSASEFREFIEAMASDYHGDTYHLISKNCNHFSDDISQRITGKRIPGWVNRLAKIGSFPFLHPKNTFLYHDNDDLIWDLLFMHQSF